MTLYAIASTVTRTTDGWTSSRSLPLFFLDSNVQGIVSVTHAEHVATGLLRDAAGEDAAISVSAYVNV